jgi:hypothetical protein
MAAKNEKPGRPKRNLPGGRYHINQRVSDQLPAAVSSAAAIAAVTLPASAPAATSSPAAPSSPTAAPAKAATPAPSSASPAAFPGGPGFIDNDVTAHKIVAIESLDGALGFLVAVDFDKSEPAWLP